MPANPKKGSLESLVKHMVERRSSVLDIISRVNQRYKNPDMNATSRYIEKWTKARGINLGIQPVTRLSDRQRAQLLQTGWANTIERTTVHVQHFSIRQKDDMGRGQVVNESWYVDIPVGLKGNKRREAIMNQLSARFAQWYDGAIKTQADLARWIYSIDIEGD